MSRYLFEILENKPNDITQLVQENIRFCLNNNYKNILLHQNNDFLRESCIKNIISREEKRVIWQLGVFQESLNRIVLHTPGVNNE